MLSSFRGGVLPLGFALLIGSSAGCGGDGDSGSPGSGGPGGASGGGGSGTGGAGGTGGGTGGSAEQDAWDGPEANVFLASMSFDGIDDTYVEGTFEEKPACKEFYDGTCRLQDCNGVDKKFIDAGELSVRGGVSRIDVPKIPDSRYFLEVTDMLYWLGDTKLTIEATGGKAPAFDLQIVAPVQPTMTDPQFDALGNVDIARSQDLDVSWDDIEEGHVEVNIFQQPDGGLGAPLIPLRLSCKFDAAAKTGTVPRSLLSKLPLGHDYNFGLRSLTESTKIDGKWRIRATAFSIGLQLDGVGAQGPATMH